jgi:hypothetical protein
VDRGDGRAQRIDLLDSGRHAGSNVDLLRVRLCTRRDGRRSGRSNRGDNRRRGGGSNGRRRSGRGSRSRRGGGLGLTTSRLGGGRSSSRRGHFSYDCGRGSFGAKQTRGY